MGLIVPQCIRDLLSEADKATGPIDELALVAKMNAAITHPESLSPEERRGVFAVVEALRFYRPYAGDRSPWGIYWGSQFTLANDEGKEQHSPDALRITQDVVANWIESSEAMKHPLLRARFADLAWDVGRLLMSRARDSEKAGQPWTLSISHTLAQRAADAYIEAINGFAEDEYHAWQLLDRAAELAISINDSARIRSAKDALFRYHREMKRTQAKYQWWRFDDVTWGRGKAFGLTTDEKQEAVQCLEDALARHSDSSNGETFDPNNAMSAADRLARRWTSKMTCRKRGPQ